MEQKKLTQLLSQDSMKTQHMDPVEQKGLVNLDRAQSSIIVTNDYLVLSLTPFMRVVISSFLARTQYLGNECVYLCREIHKEGFKILRSCHTSDKILHLRECH